MFFHFYVLRFRRGSKDRSVEIGKTNESKKRTLPVTEPRLLSGEMPRAGRGRYSRNPLVGPSLGARIQAGLTHSISRAVFTTHFRVSCLRLTYSLPKSLFPSFCRSAGRNVDRTIRVFGRGTLANPVDCFQFEISGGLGYPPGSSWGDFILVPHALYMQMSTGPAHEATSSTIKSFCGPGGNEQYIGGRYRLYYEPRGGGVLHSIRSARLRGAHC